MGRLAALWSRRFSRFALKNTGGSGSIRASYLAMLFGTGQRKDAAGDNWESGLIASMDKNRSGFVTEVWLLERTDEDAKRRTGRMISVLG